MEHSMRSLHYPFQFFVGGHCFPPIGDLRGRWGYAYWHKSGFGEDEAGDQADDADGTDQVPPAVTKTL